MKEKSLEQMSERILALSLAQHLVLDGWTVYVSCSNWVDVTIHLNGDDTVRLGIVLDSVSSTYHFDYEFLLRSDIAPDFYVCRCNNFGRL